MSTRFKLFAAAIAIAATALSDGPASADDWATILANAKKEGTVTVHGTPGKVYSDILVGGFNKAYPDISVKFSGLAGAAEVPKVLRERQAGIHEWDVWIGGTNSALGELKGAGFFQPLRPVLRPDITADGKWLDGFDAGWADLEKKIYYCYDGTVQNPVMINWDFIKKDSIKSLNDLAKPEFAGKIVWFDPRVTGTGGGAALTIYHNIGKDGLASMFKNQVVYTTNSQQIAEWVVRGRYPISIGFDPSVLAQFKSEGLGKNIAPLDDEVFEVQQVVPGFGCVGLVDKAPHPNAAIVYLNWLMSKEGQEEWGLSTRNSRRTDVPPVLPETAPRKGIKYFNGQAEEYTNERQELARIAREAIDGEAPRGAAQK